MAAETLRRGTEIIASKDFRETLPDALKPPFVKDLQDRTELTPFDMLRQLKAEWNWYDEILTAVRTGDYSSHPNLNPDLASGMAEQLESLAAQASLSMNFETHIMPQLLNRHQALLDMLIAQGDIIRDAVGAEFLPEAQAKEALENLKLMIDEVYLEDGLTIKLPKEKEAEWLSGVEIKDSELIKKLEALMLSETTWSNAAYSIAGSLEKTNNGCLPDLARDPIRFIRSFVSDGALQALKEIAESPESSKTREVIINRILPELKNRGLINEEDAPRVSDLLLSHFDFEVQELEPELFYSKEKLTEHLRMKHAPDVAETTPVQAIQSKAASETAVVERDEEKVIYGWIEHDGKKVEITDQVEWAFIYCLGLSVNTFLSSSDAAELFAINGIVNPASKTLNSIAKKLGVDREDLFIQTGLSYSSKFALKTPLSITKRDEEKQEVMPCGILEYKGKKYFIASKAQWRFLEVLTTSGEEFVKSSVIASEISTVSEVVRMWDLTGEIATKLGILRVELIEVTGATKKAAYKLKAPISITPIQDIIRMSDANIKEESKKKD